MHDADPHSMANASEGTKFQLPLNIVQSPGVQHFPMVKI
jgi:hypothetical protein